MAKYSITYSCGHEGIEHLVGNETERERRIEWLESKGLCPDCYEAKKAADRAAESAAAAEANKELPSLEGSPKQVAWAETIRAKALASKGNKVPAFRLPDDLAERSKPWGLAPEDVAERMERLWSELTKVRHRLETETSAKWWIDNRHRADFQVLNAYRDMDKHIFGDAYERKEREKREAEEKSRRETEEREATRAAAIRTERDTNLADMIPKARSFVVSDKPGAVKVERDDLWIQGTDGRTARGFIDGGDWAVFEIVGEGTLESLHPEMERIAREAKAVWERSRERTRPT